MRAKGVAWLSALVMGLLLLTVLPSGIQLMVLLVAFVPLGLVLSLRIEPGLVFAAALAGSLFSSYAGEIGLPISPDRPLFALALGAALGGAPIGKGNRPRLRWRSVHTWMLLTVAVVAVNGVWAGSFDTEIGRFALLDRLGVVPFLAFTIAPLLYFTNRQRAVMAAALVGIGWYLGTTALLEGFGYKELTWPSYINNPNIGLHFERARGPFAESTAMGTALLGCLVGVVVALKTWSSRAARLSAALLVPVLLLGAIFTLTRAVWLAAIAAGLVGILADPRTRRYFVPLVLTGAVGVIAAVSLIPGLSDSISERRSEQIAVWDRLNTNRAAVEVIKEKPLVGIGWAQFARTSEDYLRQHPDYPLTGKQIEVHNVVLSRLAEIGLLGTIPWLIVLLLSVAAPALRRAPPDLEAWRIGLLMYGTAWAVMGMFGPMSASFPNLLLWTFGGIVAAPFTTWRDSRLATAIAQPRQLEPA
jgi:O-antigen ligase